MASIDLTTVDAVKNAIALPTGDVDLDVVLPDLITQASQAITNHCKREFIATTTPATRRFQVNAYTVNLTPYDLRTAYTVTLHPESTSTVVDPSKYHLLPINPQRGVYTSLQFSGYLTIISQTMMEFGYALVDINGDWGFAAVPTDVRRACNITVGSWVTRTISGASYGIPTDASGGAMTFRNDWDLPWAAVKLLGRYRRGSARWV